MLVWHQKDRFHIEFAEHTCVGINKYQKSCEQSQYRKSISKDRDPLCENMNSSLELGDRKKEISRNQKVIHINEDT